MRLDIFYSVDWFPSANDFVTKCEFEKNLEDNDFYQRSSRLFEQKAMFLFIRKDWTFHVHYSDLMVAWYQMRPIYQCIWGLCSKLFSTK